MQTIFRRYEKKYLITRKEHEVLQELLSRHMKPDRYSGYLVQNLYYDTEDWKVIRASIERPLYKEKMRLRCYGLMEPESNLFIELKKKYNGVVHKRRIAVPAKTLSHSTVRDIVSENGSQIGREINFYMNAKAVSEKIYISYRRSAFAGIEDSGLRVTFDSDIRFRLDALNCSCPNNGQAILPQGKTLMEIKTFGAMPLWLAHALSENKIFSTPFSKYGVCYTGYILKDYFSKYGAERKVLINA